MVYRKKKIALLVIGATLITGAQEASAWDYMTDDIFAHCNGKDMIAGYETENASCKSCHGNRNDKSAYNSGNLDYFCPASTTADPTCTDADGDGYYVEGDSCGTKADFNDRNSSAYPGATENCFDGIDNDGNGLTDSADPNAVGCDASCTDSDADGYSTEGGSCGAIDCNDNDASINPGAVEVCSDGIDNNCNNLTDTADKNAVGCSLDCTDSDGDGFSIGGRSCGAMDCDDNNANVNPGALEVCTDSIDNNCDGRADSADNVCRSSNSDRDRDTDTTRKPRKSKSKSRSR